MTDDEWKRKFKYELLRPITFLVFVILVFISVSIYYLYHSEEFLAFGAGITALMFSGMAIFVGTNSYSSFHKLCSLLGQDYVLEDVTFNIQLRESSVNKVYTTIFINKGDSSNSYSLEFVLKSGYLSYSDHSLKKCRAYFCKELAMVLLEESGRIALLK